MKSRDAHHEGFRTSLGHVLTHNQGVVTRFSYRLKTERTFASALTQAGPAECACVCVRERETRRTGYSLKFARGHTISVLFTMFVTFAMRRSVSQGTRLQMRESIRSITRRWRNQLVPLWKKIRKTWTSRWCRVTYVTDCSRE